MSVARAVMTRSDRISLIVLMLYDSILCSLWVYSTVAQASGDFSDPEHPSSRPWYLTHNCSEGRKSSVVECRASQAAFALSLSAVCLYGTRLFHVCWKTIRNRRILRKEYGYHAPSVVLDRSEGPEDGESENERMERERERYLYREALSPVLAFFPENGRW